MKLLEKLLANFRPVRSAAEELTPEQIAHRKKQKRMIVSVGCAVIVAVTAWWIIDYIVSAPQRSEAAYREGLRLLRPGTYDRARLLFDRAISIDSTNAEAYVARGLAERYLGRRESALANFTRAIELRPALVKAYANRASTLREMGDFQKALADLNEALNREPSTDNYNERARTYQELGDYQRAIEDYTKVIDTLPDSPHPYRARGLCREKLGDTAGAAGDRASATQIERKGPALIKRM